MDELPASGSTSSGVARRRTTAYGCVVLGASLAAAATVAALLWRGAPGFAGAILFAAALCLPSSIAGWVLARRPARKPGEAVAGPLTAITVRLLPPLAGLAWLSTPGGRQLREGGAGEMLVGFYLVQLVTDILLHIIVSRKQTSPPRDHA